MRLLFPIFVLAAGCSTNLPGGPEGDPDFGTSTLPDLTPPPADLTPVADLTPPPDLPPSDPCANCKALGQVCCIEGSGMSLTASCKPKPACHGSTAACRQKSDCPGTTCCADIKFAQNGDFSFDSSCRSTCKVDVNVQAMTATSKLCDSDSDCSGGNALLGDCCSAGGIHFCASKIGAAQFNYTCP